ncbi:MULTISPECIES: DUF732 domain-containing protein [unclassified Nonomuraea]|uniref:DUF732 domain-containing protein n=1 Tax=unclassified Nonomuraea TaxID=2593643 RepID=UPI0033EA2BEE
MRKQVSESAEAGGDGRRTRVLAVAGTALVAGVSVVLVVTSLVTAGGPASLPPGNAGHAALLPPAGGELPPGLGAEPDRAFLRRLERIAPWLAPEEDAALSRARATCRDIVAGKPGEELVSDAQERFTDVTREQAARIVEAVREWCPAPAASFAS